MFRTNTWELTDFELRMVEKAFNREGSIFVGPMGFLSEEEKDGYERVDSKGYDFLVFIDEIRSTKIIRDMKVGRS